MMAKTLQASFGFGVKRTWVGILDLLVAVCVSCGQVTQLLESSISAPVKVGIFQNAASQSCGEGQMR